MKRLKQSLPLLGLALAVTLTFPFADYTRQDINISQLSELWLLFGLHLAVTAVFFALYRLILKTNWGTVLATVGSVFVLLQKFPLLYDFLSAGTPGWHPVFNSVMITVLVLASIGAGIRAGEFIMQKWRPAWQGQLFVMTLFISAGIIAFSSYAFITYLVRHHQAYTFKPKSTLGEAKPAQHDGRDIYYLVFDRYASQETLLQQFSFDNSPFLNTLRDQGFAVRDDAVANYQYTAPSVASTVRMGYHTDIAKNLAGEKPASYLPYKTIMERSPTSLRLQQSGYKIYNYGNWWNVSRKQQDAINIVPFGMDLFGRRYNLSEIQGNALRRTFLNNSLQHGLGWGREPVIKMELSSPRDLYLGQMKGLNDLAKTRSDKPRFVFAHLINPHSPYVFTKDGGVPKYGGDEDNIDVPRRDKYINQLEYANQTIIELVANIKANAAKPPIIIIQADEGPYPLEPVPAWQKASDDTLQLKFGTLAAYHMPEVAPEQAVRIDSPVNIFRFMFNRYFGDNLPYLPDCSYVFNNDDQPYRFYDITSKLHDKSPDCQRYERP